MTNAPSRGRESTSRNRETSNRDFTTPARSAHPAETILSRLGHIRETGNGQWLACCPAHDDKSPSLSIRELSNATVLINCLSGCETADVLNAIALEFKDLYPRDPRSPRREYPGDRLSGREIVSVISHELTIIEIAARTMMVDPAPSPDDAKRLALACSRVRGVVRDVL